MYKKSKTLVCTFLIFINLLLFQSSSFAKYTWDVSNIVAQLNIDRHAPEIELLDISSANPDDPNLANKKQIITGHLKLTEKNIRKNDISIHTIKVLVNNEPVNAFFSKFKLLSIDSTNGIRLYEFCFTNILVDGSVSIMLPEGTVVDKAGSKNVEKVFPTNIIIDNSSLS